MYEYNNNIIKNTKAANDSLAILYSTRNVYGYAGKVF